MVVKNSFGMTGRGEEAFLYTLKSEKGIILKVTNYGATLCSLEVPDKNNIMRDVVLGYDNVADYDKKTGLYLGATVGRNANRIANGTFTLDGKTYNLEKYNGNNNLHSGANGFSYRVWEEKEISDNSVTFQIYSPDGDQGYPNAVDVEVTYQIVDECIHIIYKAKADEKVFLNMTNHSYFNLEGHQAGNVLDQQMWLNADGFVEINENLIPTGRILAVENTPMDFRKKKKIGCSINEDYEQLIRGNGYDHCWVLNKGEKLVKAAELYAEGSGINMEVFTDLPGVQIYTGNFIDNEVGKENAVYQKNQGVCFETQYFPNAINIPEFEIGVVDKDTEYCSETIFKFTV